MDVVNGQVKLQEMGVGGVRQFSNIDDGLNYASQIYRSGIEGIQDKIRQLNDGKRPEVSRDDWGYPVLAIPVQPISPTKKRLFHGWASGWFRRGSGLYTSEFSQIDPFRPYLTEELGPLLERFNTQLLVGKSSSTSIPVDLALNGSGLELNFSEDLVWEHFHRPMLEKTNWKAFFGRGHRDVHRLAHYEALPTDMATHRFLHYTGTSAQHLQKYVFFTNFANHLLPFLAWGQAMMADPNSGCIGIEISPGLEGNTNYFKLPAHPAIHVKFANGEGISMINVGVGAPNIWKVVDCIAPMRPYCVILLGICGGLRQTQRQGMFILAQDFESFSAMEGHEKIEQGTVNGEIQQAMMEGICQRLGIDPNDRDAKREWIEKAKLRTTYNRGWEFRLNLIRRFLLSKCGAVEMEAKATIDSCGFHRIPAAFCGILSDVPVNGDFRLPGSSSRFFRENVENHVMSAINAWQILRKNPRKFQSRLLREDRFWSPMR